MTDSVLDIPDNALIYRALCECRRGRKRKRVPLWSVVSRIFALGSTFSADLCRRFGFDPDEQVREY
jgi:hypothetical protein